MSSPMSQNTPDTGLRAALGEEAARDLACFVGSVKALLRHTNPHLVNEGHAQQWFAVSDAIGMKIEPLLSTPVPDKAGDRDGLEMLRRAFRNADAEDWQRLDDLLGFSGHGRFWRAVMAEVRDGLILAALAPTGNESPRREGEALASSPEAWLVTRHYHDRPSTSTLLPYEPEKAEAPFRRDITPLYRKAASPPPPVSTEPDSRAGSRKLAGVNSALKIALQDHYMAHSDLGAREGLALERACVALARFYGFAGRAVWQEALPFLNDRIAALHPSAPTASASDDPICTSATLPKGWLAAEIESAREHVSRWPAGLLASFVATHGPLPEPPAPTASGAAAPVETDREFLKRVCSVCYNRGEEEVCEGCAPIYAHLRAATPTPDTLPVPAKGDR